MITDVLAVRDSTIARNPALVAGLIRGTLEGLAFMHREPARRLPSSRKTLDISAADVQAQLPNIENPPLAQLSDVSQERGAAFFPRERQGDRRYPAAQGQIQALPAIDDTYDARFVTALQANPGDLQ